MTHSPRWERESEPELEPLAPQPPQPQQTEEFDLAAAGLVDPEPDEPGATSPSGDTAEHPAVTPPWLAAARESLSATRRSMGEWLAVVAESIGETLASTRESIAVTAGRVGDWLRRLDRRPELDADLRRDPVAELETGSAVAGDLAPGPAGESGSAPGPAGESGSAPAPAGDPGPAPAPVDAGVGFPTSPLGYSRAAVDDYIAELEAENDALRAVAEPKPPTITEELERIGEQTASILVVAHDRATETARRAQEQAERAVRIAADDAARITGEAERRLADLDEETDAVWRERERLLGDVRAVSAELARLADAAGRRFPAEDREAEVSSAASG